MADPSVLTDRSPVWAVVDALFKSDCPRTIDRYIDYFGGDGTPSPAETGDETPVEVAVTDEALTA